MSIAWKDGLSTPMAPEMEPAEVQHEAYPEKARLIAEYTTHIKWLEAEISRLTEERSRTRALLSMVSKAPGDLIETLVQGRA